MSRSPSARDPYRVLGVPRDAGDEAIKAAHRTHAKQSHPDAGGDEQRFLAVQAAYQLLSDPVARGDWDRRHMPGPVRAKAGRPRSRATSSRCTREDTTAYRPGRGKRADRGRPDYRDDGSGRDPRTHHHTWSAEGVPWWEDFVPKGATPPPQPPRKPASGAPSAEPRSRPDFDVYDRSSGAAWSMAARRHFRRGDADLPSRGAFRYRGTQVVTGAEARKVAAEEAAAEGATAERQTGTERRPAARRRAAGPAKPANAASSTASTTAASSTASTTATSSTASTAAARGTDPRPTPADAASPMADPSPPQPPATVAPRPEAPGATPVRPQPPPATPFPAETDGAAVDRASSATPTAPTPSAPTPAAGSPSAPTRSAGSPSAPTPTDLAPSVTSPGSAATSPEPTMLPSLVGAVAAPSVVLFGAGATGSLDDVPGMVVLLLLAATVVAGGAIGRALGIRRTARAVTRR